MTKATTAPEVPKKQSISIFDAIGQTLAATVGVFTSTARTAEKSVNLVEKEVDMLHLMQDQRILETKADLLSAAV